MKEEEDQDEDDHDSAKDEEASPCLDTDGVKFRKKRAKIETMRDIAITKLNKGEECTADLHEFTCQLFSLVPQTSSMCWALDVLEVFFAVLYKASKAMGTSDLDHLRILADHIQRGIRSEALLPRRRDELSSILARCWALLEPILEIPDLSDDAARTILALFKHAKFDIGILEGVLDMPMIYGAERFYASSSLGARKFRYRLIKAALASLEKGTVTTRHLSRYTKEAMKEQCLVALEGVLESDRQECNSTPRITLDDNDVAAADKGNLETMRDNAKVDPEELWESISGDGHRNADEVSMTAR